MQKYVGTSVSVDIEGRFQTFYCNVVVRSTILSILDVMLDV